MNDTWCRERVRAERHRTSVEEHARNLPSRTRFGSPSGRVLVNVVRRARRTLSRQATNVGRTVQRGLVVGVAAGGRRARERRELALRAELARSRVEPPAPSVAWLIEGHPNGPAHRAARRATSGPPLEYDRSRRRAAPDFVCVMASTAEPLSASWLATLAAAIDHDVVAAAPTVVRPLRRPSQSTPQDGAVLAAGLTFEVDDNGAPLARPRDQGQRARPEDRVERVDAAAGACLLVRRDAFDRVGGLATSGDHDADVVDLCVRLAAAGGCIVVSRAAFVVDHAENAVVERDVMRAPTWREVVERRGPTLWRQAARVPSDEQHLRFAVSIAAPSERLAARWGDWHFAGALARALERRGHLARVQTFDHANDLAGRSADVHVVLRGREPVRRTSGQRHVLWIISHPDAVDMAECDESDLVLVASHRFAEHVRARTTTPVEVLLQATDHHRFRPRQPDPRHAHRVAIVAKTRDEPRRIVLDAIEAGLRPAIYGTGWEAFVDPSLVVAPYVPNDELPTVYSSIGVLLNDHWASMRDWGFVSNRIFDAIACGTSVVSDLLPEIDELFDGAVPTYDAPSDLRRLVDSITSGDTHHHAQIERAREAVLQAHTFDARVRTILDLLAQHELVGRSTS